MLELEVTPTKEMIELVARLTTVAEKLEALHALMSNTDTATTAAKAETEAPRTSVQKARARLAVPKAVEEAVADELAADALDELDAETETDTTLDDVIRAMKALPAATRTKTVGKILTKLGAKRVQDLKPAQFNTALSMLR